MEEIEIGRTGKLYSHTISYFAPKGFTAPSFQAFIDLPEGPRVFSLIGSKYPVERGVLEDGMEMRLIVEPLADTPEHKDELTYKYVPAQRSNAADARRGHHRRRRPSDRAVPRQAAQGAGLSGDLGCAR